MSWTRFASCRLGAESKELVAVREDGRSRHGPAGALWRTRECDLASRSGDGSTRAQRGAGRAPQGSGDLRVVPCARRRILRRMDSRPLAVRYTRGVLIVPRTL